MSDTPLLQLQNITKTFGSVQALDDVDFEVRAGEVMALVGDNGAGKSTLVKCVAGTHSADSGRDPVRGTARCTSTGRRTPRGSGSRSSTRISRSATTSTSSRTCTWAARSTELRSSPKRRWSSKRPRRSSRWRSRRSSRSARGWRPSRAASVSPSPSPGGACGTRSSSSSTSRPPLSASRRPSRCSSSCAASASQGLGVMLISHNLHDIFETADRITVLRLGRNVGVFERTKHDAAGGRRGDHRRRTDEGLRDPGHRRRRSRRVSSADVIGADQAPPPPLEEEQLPGGFRGARERMWLNVRTGNLGPIPIIVGELAVVDLLRVHRDELLHVGQLRQPDRARRRERRCSRTASSSCCCSGEIDLSIGYLAGIGALHRRGAPAPR